MKPLFKVSSQVGFSLLKGSHVAKSSFDQNVCRSNDSRNDMHINLLLTVYSNYVDLST